MLPFDVNDPYKSPGCCICLHTTQSAHFEVKSLSELGELEIIQVEFNKSNYQKKTMAFSKATMITLITLSLSLLITNALPISEGFSSLSSEGRFRPLGVILFAPELGESQDSLYHNNQSDTPTLHRSERNARSIVDEQEQSQNAEDDLETAAGTNLLRPLFVYRQQMAYRERTKKAARRAAPDYY